MIDDTATVLSSAAPDLEADDFIVVAQDVTDASTSPSEVEGYTGRLLVTFQIQDDK